MKKKVVLLVISLLLAACAEAPLLSTPFDPNLSAIQQQMTAQSAADQAFIFSSMATGTAQAPIIDITSSAAAFSIIITKQSIDETSTAAAWTATSTPVPTVTMTPTPDITQTVAVHTYLVQKDIDDKAAARREFNNAFWAWAQPILFIFFIAFLLIAGLTTIRHLRHKFVERDQFGKIQPIFDNVTGNYLDLSASPNYAHINKSLFEQIVLQWLERTYGFVPNMPHNTEKRQDITKEREQVIEIERIRRSRLPKALIDAQSLQFLPEPTEATDLTQEDAEIYPELPFPSWAQLNKWDGHLLPVGNDENSNLMLVDTSLRPHLLYAGRSRSGKTLTGERTAVACLLTQGWNVIVMGKRVDWMPFTDHPNFKLLAVDVRKDAQKYIDILQILSDQMDIRDSLLTSKGISTWDRYGAPSTMVVLDDYSGALVRMPKSKANEVIAEVRSIALDGAKFGLSITIGLQDATAQNIDTTTRSQMARIVYSMDNATKSRIALGSNSGDGAGAECLPPFRHFLARVSDDTNIRRGVGFFLQDREVEAFLASRPVQQNGQLEWIDGVIVDQPALPKQESVRLAAPITESPAMSKVMFVNGLQEWEVRVLDLYESGLDQAQIVESVFAGDDRIVGKVAVTDIIQRWQAIKSANTITNTTTITEPINNAQAELERITKENEAEAAQKRIDEEAQIRLLNAKGISNTNIVYKVWGKSGSAVFGERMARVKQVLGTAATATASPENKPDVPINGALPA